MASEGRRPVGRGDEAGAGRDEKALDIGLRVLDQQLTDSEGRYCGRVDDIELDVTSEGDARIVCLLVGWVAARRRRPWLLRPFARLLRGLGDAPEVRVGWDEVAEVAHVVRLRRSAADLGLAEGDRRLGPLVGRLPGA